MNNNNSNNISTTVVDIQLESKEELCNHMNENHMNENIMNENIMNENHMNENHMNENSMNENHMNENIMNENHMNENIMNENSMNENSMNENHINENSMNENHMNENIMNETTVNKIPDFVLTSDIIYTDHNTKTNTIYTDPNFLVIGEQTIELNKQMEVQDIIINARKNINEWSNYFDIYIKTEKKCNQHMNSILEIKNNFIKLLGNQNEEDIIYYKSIIDNSYYYLNNSLKIRKHKFIKDINSIWEQININKNIIMSELNKKYFQLLLKDYEKMAKDIYNARINNNTLLWVKNDMIESLYKIETTLNEILNYHNSLIDKIYNMIELDQIFYCGKK